MGFRKTSITAILWSYADKFLKRGVSFIVALVLARLLEPSDYGLLAMAAVFLAIGNVFTDFGLGQAIIQADEIDDKKCSTIFYINLATGIVISSLLFVTSGLIGDFYNEPRLTNIVKIISVTYIFNSVNLIHGMRFYRELNIKSLTTLNVISDVSSGVLGITLALLEFGVWSLVYQRIARSFIYTILIWSKSKWIPLLYFNFKEIKEMFHFGIGMFGIGLIQEISSYADTIVMGKFMSPTFIGLLDRGKSFPEFMKNTIVLPLTRPLFPIFSKIKHEPQRLKEIAFEILNNLMPVMFLGYGLLSVFSEEFISVLLGDKWIDSAIYLRVFSNVMVCSLIYGVSTNLYKALGKKKVLIYLIIVEKVLLLISLLCGVFVDLRIYFGGLLFVNIGVVGVVLYINNRHVKGNWWRYGKMLIYFYICTIGFNVMKITILEYNYSLVLLGFGCLAVFYFSFKSFVKSTIVSVYKIIAKYIGNFGHLKRE